jgi:hypothetical protein
MLVLKEEGRWPSAGPELGGGEVMILPQTDEAKQEGRAFCRYACMCVCMYVLYHICMYTGLMGGSHDPTSYR